MARRVLTRALAGAMASVLTVVLVACSEDPEDEEVVLPGDSLTPTASPEPPPLTPEEEEILEVFNGFRELEVELYTDPDSDEATERFPEYLTGALLSSLAFGVDVMVIRNQVRVGQPSWDPTVVEVTADTATIRDCYDATDWQLVDRDTGEPAPEQETIGSGGSDLPVGRHVMTYGAVRDDSGPWLFESTRLERDEQC